MDFSKAFNNTLNNLPCLSCGIVRKKHNYIYHKYVDPMGEKERTSIKTERGMKPDCIRDLEIYDRNNDYDGHLSRLDMEGSFRSSGGFHKQPIQPIQPIQSIKPNKQNRQNKPNKQNKQNKPNKPNESNKSKELRGLEDLTLFRDLDGHKSRNTDNDNDNDNDNYNKNKINTRCASCNIPKNKHYMVNCIYQEP